MTETGQQRQARCRRALGAFWRQRHDVLNRGSKPVSAQSGPGEARDASSALPRIAIIGRPNVGKSTLFNTLTRRRAALVYDSPGSHVTRDYKEAVASLSDLRFVAVDTSGLEPYMSVNSILGRATSVTRATLRDTIAALLVVDGRAGISSHDHEVANWLRASYAKPIVLVCNKMDHPENQDLMAQAHEFSRLGLGNAIAVSAETRAGMVDLYAALQPIVDAHTSEPSSTGPDEALLAPAPSADGASAPGDVKPLPRRVRSLTFGGWDLPSEASGASRGQEESASGSRTPASDAGAAELQPSTSSAADAAAACGSDELQAASADRSHAGVSGAFDGGHDEEPDSADDSAEEHGVAASTQQEGSGAGEADQSRDAIKLALMGLPNVGKSTLFNHLMGFERVLTGPEPGLTRDAVTSTFEWGGRKFELTDTAGWIRHGDLARYDDVGGKVAGLTVLQGTAKMNYAHAVVLVVDGVVARNKIVEARHPFVQVMSRRELDLAGRVLDEGRILVVAPNKLDHLSTEERQVVMTNLRQQIDTSLASWSDCVSVAPLSASVGRGVDKILNTIVELHDKWSAKLATSVLNNWRYKMSLAYAGHGQNPLSSLKYLKMISTRPPTFLAHFRGKVVSKEFPRAIGKHLRRSFGMEGVPIRVVPMSKGLRAEQDMRLQRATKRALSRGELAPEGLNSILRKPKSRRVPNLAA